MRANVREIYQLHAEICQALSDPKRLLILDSLRDGPLSVSELVEMLGFRQANISQHLAVLRQRSMVQSRREGSNMFYELADPKIAQMMDLLKEIWANQLDRKQRLASVSLDAL